MAGDTMEKLCDLHTHSTYSDGTYSPIQLIAEAERVGLSAIALTDHNTLTGLPEFLSAAETSSVEAIPGIEFSTDYIEMELHIVCLFIKPEHYPTITEITDEINRRKQQSNIDLIDKLRQAGFDISYDRIKATMPQGEPNRALIGAELMRLGYVTSVKEGFQKLLGAKCGYYTPPKHIDAFELISIIRNLGAVPILAHPFLSIKDEQQLEVFLAKAAACGLLGIETRYPLFSDEQTSSLEILAKKYGLAQSGGSDFHGENKPDIRLGSGKGALQVPLSFLNDLRQRTI